MTRMVAVHRSTLERMVPFIDSDKTRQLAHHHMVGLLNGNDPRKAARYAETVRASEEWEWAAQELLAVALMTAARELCRPPTCNAASTFSSERRMPTPQ